ncbi:MAG: cupredoxin domain-containing protein [Cytophagales bacterium]|nr:cupredoxin domain-containing protein [Armatimonadota bacterium]
MDASEIGVIVGGTALVGFLLWFFFGEREKTEARISDSGVQEVTVTVKGGYSPDTIVVKQGRPVRLNFYRDETSGCSEQVVFGDFGLARDLPAHQTTPIEFTPDKAGEFVFTCGMNMLRGRLVVQPSVERVPNAPRSRS